MANLINAINNSNNVVLIDYDVNSDHIIAVFCPSTKVDDPQESDLILKTIEFQDQEVETVSGWEYPVYTTQVVTPSDDYFDIDLAVKEALERANSIF